MAGMVGADPEELDALAQRFRVLAGKLDSSRASLGSQIHNNPWSGPAAEGFRNDWDGHHSRVLTAVARSLGQAATSLTSNANEQRQASGPAFTGGHGGVAARPGSASPTGTGNVTGRGVESAAVFASFVTLPLLTRTYDLLTKVDSYTGLIKVLETGNVARRIPVISWITSGYDLFSTAPQTLADVESGNVWRMSKAVFRTGWTIAKIIPLVGLVDAAANVGLDSGKMIGDGIFGPGTSDRAFTDLGQQIDKAGNDFNHSGEVAGKWVAHRITEGVTRIFHL